MRKNKEIIKMLDDLEEAELEISYLEGKLDHLKHKLRDIGVKPQDLERWGYSALDIGYPL